MAVNRADVARLAGTSPAVVSYVLNGGPRGVAPQTRERVLAAIEKLGYRPNGIARALRMNRTMTLGLVVPDTANPFFAELARAIEEEAFAQDYTLLIGNAAEDDDRQTTYVRTFLARQVDGLFLVPAHGPLSCLADLQRAQHAVGDCSTGRCPGVAPAVLVDNRGGAYAATAHLLEHGRQRIACIGRPAGRDAGDRPGRRLAGRARRGGRAARPRCRSGTRRSAGGPATSRRARCSPAEAAGRDLRGQRRAGARRAAGRAGARSALPGRRRDRLVRRRRRAASTRRPR